MACVKSYKNLKTGPNMAGLVSGPRNITGAQVSSMVPCRGAKSVFFHLTSTDVNVPVAVTSNFSNDQERAISIGASSLGANELVILQRMNAPGGVTYMVTFTGQALSPGFIQLAITSHASGHTAFNVDVDVFYDTDASDVRQSFGQGAIDAVIS